MQSGRDNNHVFGEFDIMNKKGQEEMVGFALIVIIVSVIILVFLGFFLSSKNNESTKTLEAENFVLSSLQYSTECTDYYGYISLKNLIFLCNSQTDCVSGQDSCEVLNSTLQGILNQSWKVGGGSSIKGYELNISSNTGWILDMEKGNLTGNSEGTLQPFSDGTGASVNIVFNVYH